MERRYQRQNKNRFGFNQNVIRGGGGEINRAIKCSARSEYVAAYKA